MDAAKIIRLAERAAEIIEIVELKPNNGTFIGKHIQPDGEITQYPKSIAWWQQRVAGVPATIPAAFNYLREARTRNICLIRGSPANLGRRETRRQKAGIFGGRDRGDHGFLDLPTRFLPLDVDGAKTAWKADPEGAIRRIVGELGEPWASTSFVWFFSATHGLELDKQKRWTRRLSDGVVRVRLAFIAERALDEAEAVALTRIAKAHSGLPLDESIVRCVQPNYIKRPHWIAHPDRDPLGNIATIGWVKGERDTLAVPDDLTHTARWAAAQGHHVDIADHPDAATAVRGIGSDGAVRPHVMAAVMHLLIANPANEVTSHIDHAKAIVRTLIGMVERQRTEICDNLAGFGRGWGDVQQYLPDNMADFAVWVLDHPSAYKSKTIKLAKEEAPHAETEASDAGDAAAAEAIFARAERTIERARKGEASDVFLALANNLTERANVELLVAPPGARKSTLMRSAAVLYTAEHPDKTVVILVPYLKLGDELLDQLQAEHPGVDAAVWRGRHRDDPENPGKKMCWRSTEAAELEKAQIDVEEHLCKQGRGEDTIKCPFYNLCGTQQQKLKEASIWFGAHELLTHEPPKAFGKIGWVIIDENPTDAFLLGTDSNAPIELALDALLGPVPDGLDKDDAKALAQGRRNLHHRLDQLKVPIDPHRGAPVTSHELDRDGFGGLSGWWEESARRMRTLEWKGKITPTIRPDMSPFQVRKLLKTAEGNGVVAVRALLWWLVEKTLAENYERNAGLLLSEPYLTTVSGRIQVHRGHNGQGRVIRMADLRRIANDWNVQTLICDATGDAELLRAVWPHLEEAEPHGWEQLPRPEGVRIFQCVDRSKSKWDVAVEGKNPKELARQVKAAREMYGAVLRKALEYGGQDVGLIVYKSTREWIEQNCFVPPWLKLFHFGALVGSNALARVRALFVIGRLLASAEAVARQVEALFGEYVCERDYPKPARGKLGRIPIVPDAKGNNTILVKVLEHPDPMGARVGRQITVGAILQAVGRGRAGLRKAGEPLDIHLWTDVPVGELGPIVPVLWRELEAGLDGAMLAAEGIWLECVPDAAEAFKGLVGAAALRWARRGRSSDSFLIGNPYKETITTSPSTARYHRLGQGRPPARVVSLHDPATTKAWLEEKLGPLASFAVEGAEASAKPAGAKSHGPA